MKESYQFYLVIPVGLEKIALEELSYWWPLLQKNTAMDSLPPVERTKGGLEFTCAMNLGLQLNYLLKIPSRILLRLQVFPCTSFKEFSKKISQISWSEFWSEPLDIKLHTSSHGSALYTAKRIEGSFRDGWKEFWKGETGGGAEGKPISNSSQSIFVRLVDDVATVSLDTSGEHLHRRGQRSHIGQAPLRENLAAALLWLMIGKNGFNNLGETILADPMSGSGIFMLEAYQLLKVKKERDYSFQNWKKGQRDGVARSHWQQETFGGYELWDIDKKMLQAIDSNQEGIPEEMFEVRHSDIIDLQGVSSKEMSGREMGGEEMSGKDRGANPLWVIVNPPYGERLKVEGSLVDYYSRLCMNIQRVWQPSVVGLIIPRKVGIKKIKTSPHWESQKSWFFQNGGIPVGFHLFSVKREFQRPT